MMLSSMIRRVISQKIGGGRRSLCSGGGDGASELLRRGAPCLMKTPSFTGGGDMEYHFYSPMKDDVLSFKNKGGKEEADLMRDDDTICAGTSHGWLALFNSGDMCLLNPFSGRRIELPPYRGKPFTGKDVEPFPFKVILSHPPDEAACLALMVLGSTEKAVYCRCGPPWDRSRWAPLGRWDDYGRVERKLEYCDFAYSTPRSCFVGSARGECDHEEDLELWDHPTVDLLKTVSAPTGNHLRDPGVEWVSHIVSGVETGQLYLVRRFLIDQNSVDYNVYRIHDNGGVRLCSSLDDLAMFVGINHSFAVEASQFSGLKPNSIYFSGYWFYENQMSDVFEYETKEYTTLFPLPPDRRVLPWLIPKLN